VNKNVDNSLLKLLNAKAELPPDLIWYFLSLIALLAITLMRHSNFLPFALKKPACALFIDLSKAEPATFPEYVFHKKIIK